MVTSGSAQRAGQRERLLSGAVSLGLTLTERQTDQLLDYLALLERWNRVHNLSAIRDPDAMLGQHLLDSLAVVAPLRRHAAGRALRILDVGCGAGLPGLVWAIAEPGWQATAIDAVAKKIAFVRQAIGELGMTNVAPVHGRVEAAPAMAAFDVVASRAFASLSDFVGLTRDRLAPHGVWLAMKGAVPRVEIAALGAGLDVFHVEHLEIPGLVAKRCLVWIRAR